MLIPVKICIRDTNEPAHLNFKDPCLLLTKSATNHGHSPGFVISPFAINVFEGVLLETPHSSVLWLKTK